MIAITITSLVLLNGGCATQSERIVTLENKLNVLSKSVDGLEPEINALSEKLAKQESGTETTLSLQRNASSHLEEGLSETKNLLKEIKRSLALTENDTSKTKEQMEELRTKLNRLETLSKLSGSKTSLTSDLLDKAINSYSQGNFEDAISKWEEVLVHEPDKLEAKFNIEIAKDRIKEKQIHDELKALLIQRK
jgi:chromosome segregation ATPase